jgi:hypothetical protein
MEALLQLLQESVSGMQADAAVIIENQRAMNTMGDDIVTALREDSERRQAAYAAKRQAYVASLPIHDYANEGSHA